MKDLIKRHSAATWERGMITPDTTIREFINKINEEFIEFKNADIDNYYDGDSYLNMSPEMAHEAVDICATVINMLTFYGIDFIKEYRKNVEYQESRV